MPALEICGVVLGVIPLVISALEHYKDGKSVAAAIIKWRGQLDTLISRLKNQKMFFYLHILELLREAQVVQADPTEEECVDVLRDEQIGEEVQKYLGSFHNRFMEVLSHYERCLKTIVAKIGHIRRLPDVSSIPRPTHDPGLLRSPIRAGIRHLLLGTHRQKETI